MRQLKYQFSGQVGQRMQALILFEKKRALAFVLYTLISTLAEEVILSFPSSVRVLDGKRVFFSGRRKKPVQNLFFPVQNPGVYSYFFQDGFFRFLPWFFPPPGKKPANTVPLCLSVCLI